MNVKRKKSSERSGFADKFLVLFTLHFPAAATTVYYECDTLMSVVFATVTDCVIFRAVNAKKGKRAFIFL